MMFVNTLILIALLWYGALVDAQSNSPGTIKMPITRQNVKNVPQNQYIYLKYTNNAILLQGERAN
jgi:hypothetical protein